MNLFDYRKIGPEILQSYEIERKMASLMKAKIRKVKNVEVLYTKKTYIKSSIYDSINICIPFV